MWMNCLGFTAFCKSSGETSCRTYSPGKEGSGGLASVLGMRPPLGPYHGPAERRGPRHLGSGRLTATLLERDPQRHLQTQHHDVDGCGDDVAQGLERDDDPATSGRRLDGGVAAGEDHGRL